MINVDREKKGGISRSQNYRREMHTVSYLLVIRLMILACRQRWKPYSSDPWSPVSILDSRFPILDVVLIGSVELAFPIRCEGGTKLQEGDKSYRRGAL